MKYLSIDQAAAIMHCTRLAVYKAIRKNRLTAHKIWIKYKTGSTRFKWHVTKEDLDKYNETRYQRKFSKYKGKPLYDKEKGEYSVKEVSEILKMPREWIYNKIKSKRMDASKKRSAWIINISEVERFKNLKNLANDAKEC